MQWSPRQRSGDEDDDEVDDDEDDDGDDDDDDDDDVVEADKTRHDVTADSDDDVTSYLGIIFFVFFILSLCCYLRQGG